MKQEFIAITARKLGNDVTAVKIVAQSWAVALTKLYKYIGGTVSQDPFEKSIFANEKEDCIKLFEMCSGDAILYFGHANFPMVDKLSCIGEDD